MTITDTPAPATVAGGGVPAACPKCGHGAADTVRSLVPALVGRKVAECEGATDELDGMNFPERCHCRDGWHQAALDA